MNGEVGGYFTIKPDQMQVINPLLIILFIPLWDLFVYPALAKIGIKRPLQVKMKISVEIFWICVLNFCSFNKNIYRN